MITMVTKSSPQMSYFSTYVHVPYIIISKSYKGDFPLTSIASTTAHVK